MASQTAQLTAKVRGELGSRRNKRLRDSGFVPGVIYGHKEDVVPVTLPKIELVKHLNHGAHLFALALDGKNENVLVKDVQYDHLGIEVLSVSGLLGETIHRIHHNESVSALFDGEKQNRPN